MKRLLLTGLAAALMLTSAATARTKLVTLPDREKMVMSLEHPNRTLIFEQREIPLQEGTNFIDFSWNGVAIDPRSVLIEFLSHPGDDDDSTKIIATGYPPNEQAMTWQVYSPEARTELIRVSYLLSGISQYTSYEMEINQAETQADFRQYLRIHNRSGEDLDNTIVRVPVMNDLTRSIDSGEVRRFLAERVKELPLEKLYVMRPSYHRFMGDDGEQVALVYKLENTQDGGLGGHKLPAGKARLFGADGTGSSIFLGEDLLQETPPGEDTELSVGTVKDVVVKRRLIKDEQINQRRNSSRQVVLFDQSKHIRYEIENFKEEAVTLKIIEQLNGDWEIDEITSQGVRTEKKSNSELIIYVDLPASEKGEDTEKKVVDLHTLVRNRFPGES